MRYLLDIYMNNSETVDQFWKKGKEDAVEYVHGDLVVLDERYFIFDRPTWDRANDYNVPTALEQKQSAYSLGFWSEWDKMEEWEMEREKDIEIEEDLELQEEMRRDEELYQ